MCKTKGCAKYSCRCEADMSGKVAMITGCNTGIGLETVKSLFARNCRVYMACRTLTKAEEARREVLAACEGKPEADLVVIRLDLASFKSVRECVAEYRAKERRLDVLLCNAGVSPRQHELTEDGIEMTFQANYFGHFLLINELFDLLESSAPSRIVVVSSLVHKMAGGDEPLKGHTDKAEFSTATFGTGQYSRTKMAQLLHCRRVAARLAARGSAVTFNALHPGVIHSQMADKLWTEPWYGFAYKALLRPLFFVDVVKGAQCNIHCAVCPELEKVSGEYFSCVLREQPQLGSGWEERADKLHAVSVELCGITDDKFA